LQQFRESIAHTPEIAYFFEIKSSTLPCVFTISVLTICPFNVLLINFGGLSMKAKGQFQTMRFIALMSVSALVLGAGNAMAQSEATGIADPSRAGEQLQQPDMTPEVEPELRVRDQRIQPAPAGAGKINFTLKSVNVEGASVYTDKQIQSLYADKIGQTVSLKEVYDIAGTLTLKYRNDGYILTQVVVVPPSTTANGVPTLRVVEGFVANITLQKADPNAPINMATIEAYAGQLKNSSALNARDLERQLLLINDLPGVTARSVLSRSETPGATDVTIIVDYDLFDGVLSVDNFGSRYLGPWQLGAAGTANSWLGQNEAITLQTVVAPQSWYELVFGSLGYEMPIGDYGTKVKVLGSITDTDPGYDLKQFDVKGRSYLLNVGATHPLIRSRTENLYGRLNFDWRRVKSSNDIEETRRDRLSVLRAGARYEFIDTLLGAAANTVDMEISKGLGIFGASDEGDDNMTRDAADPQATKLEADIQRLQRVTDSVNVLVGARGQIASNALLSSEEFAVGGVYGFGRGYDPSEVTGDHGIAGKVELQWNDPMALDPSYIDSYQLYGFYDIGRVWNEDATTATQERDSVAAVGGGVRFDLPHEMDGGFAVAFPLTREPATAGDRDPRFYVNFSKRF
jgi:hemolysin activation/secretion protein